MMGEPGWNFEGEEAENVELIAQMAGKGKNILDNANDVILVESESENALDNVNLLGDENVVRDGLPLKAPEIGMKFNDENELFEDMRYFYARLPDRDGGNQ